MIFIAMKRALFVQLSMVDVRGTLGGTVPGMIDAAKVSPRIGDHEPHEPRR